MSSLAKIVLVLGFILSFGHSAYAGCGGAGGGTLDPACDFDPKGIRLVHDTVRSFMKDPETFGISRECFQVIGDYHPDKRSWGGYSRYEGNTKFELVGIGIAYSPNEIHFTIRDERQRFFAVPVDRSVSCPRY